MADMIFLTDIFVESNTIAVENSNSRRLSQEETGKWTFWSRYLGPYVIASTVRQSFPHMKVKVIDYFTKIPNFFDYLGTVANEDTKYICISTTFLQNTFNARVNDFNLWFKDHELLVDWFTRLKETIPNAKIMIGGAGTDAYFKQYVLNEDSKQLPFAFRTFVDYAFHGYSEDMIVNFMNGNILPEHTRVKDGVTFFSDNTRAGINAKTLPMKWEHDDAIQEGEWLPLEISKGCRFGCKFCFFDRHGTTVKDKYVLKDELIRNYEMHGVTGYHLTDDTVNDSVEKIDMIHNVFTSLPFKIEWIAYTRPDMFHKYPEMLDGMLTSGCKGMFMGIESFNPVAAKMAGKGLDPEIIKDILAWIKSRTGNDVFILATFIIGLVGETEESLESTLQWLLKQNVIDKITYEILYVRTPNYRTTIKRDYSQTPDSFGFKTIRFFPEYYWEHDTMNFNQCKEIAQRWKEALKSSHSGADMASEGMNNFWSYPRMRSLGYSHAESFDMLKHNNMPDELYIRNDAWIQRYHRLLQR